MKKATRHFNPFLPSIILIIATLFIIIISWQLNRNNNNLNDWHYQKGIYHASLFSDISPKEGSTSGNTKVKIKGMGFDKNTKFYFGDAGNLNIRRTMLKITKISDTYAEAITPKHTPGQTDLIINAPNGSVESAKKVFTYKGSAPASVNGIVIEKIEPQKIHVNNQKIKITGSNFKPKNTIQFGQGLIKDIPSRDGKSMEFTLPESIKTSSDLTITLQPGLYDVSIIFNNKESNIKTTELLTTTD
jgi:hypothetical protein